MGKSSVPEKCKCGESLADRWTRVNGSEPMCDSCVSKYFQSLVDNATDQLHAEIIVLQKENAVQARRIEELEEIVREYYYEIKNAMAGYIAHNASLTFSPITRSSVELDIKKYEINLARLKTLLEGGKDE